MRFKKVVLALALAMIVSVMAGGVTATPGTGIVSAPILAQASFTDDVAIEFRLNDEGHEHVINLEVPSALAIQNVVIGPGGQTGWHTHPDPAIVLVKSGKFKLFDGEDDKC